MANFQSYYGMITMISDFWTGNEQTTGCYKFMSVENTNGGVVNFVVRPDTYFVDHIMMTEGDMVIGFYDANLPVPLIYPPQYQAIVMAKTSQQQNVKVDYFNSELLSNDGTLKLNISPTTLILLENGQHFTGNPANRNLIVVYGATTRSIPAQTTPYQIIVMC
ncbi:MAG: hypothetical protein K0S01_1078 [Herbinix sp.]|nr:hypothetical protein [Herbinix sp.]